MSVFKDIKNRALTGVTGDIHGNSYLSRVAAMQIGEGTKVMRADQSGFWLGAAKWADAPFRVDMQGNATATSITVSGYIVTGGAAGDVNAGAVTVSGGKITAASVTIAKLDFTPLTSSGATTEVIATINASAEGITIEADNIAIAGTTTFTAGWAAATNAETDIDVLNTANAPAAAGADVTGSNTAADTALVSGLAAARVAGWAHASDTTKIDGGDIYTNTVTATQIYVVNLAALTADMGAITAGTLTLDGAGHVKGGQTAYNTGDGFFLGYSTDAYKFSIGDGDENYLKWDGSELHFSGVLSLIENLVFKSYTVALLPGAATDTGWVVATANENATAGVTNPGNSYASDDSYTTITDTASQYYDLKTFGFSLPASSVIRGIRVRVELSPAAAGTAAAEINLSHDGGSTWHPSDVGDNVANSNSGDENRYAGTSADTWGRTWANTEFSDANFRVRVKSDSGVSTVITRIDVVHVKVWYSDPAAAPPAAAGCYASDGRKAGEGGGSGTGVWVFYDGSNYIACDTGATVAA